MKLILRDQILNLPFIVAAVLTLLWRDVIDQLTAHGIVEASVLYEPPFSKLHAGGPDELFQDQEIIIDDIFQTLTLVYRGLTDQAS